MRKLYSTHRHKLRNLSKAKKSLKSRLSFKRKKKSKNKLKIGRNQAVIAAINRVNKYFDYKRVKVPENFSFLTGAEKASSFIHDLKKLFNKKKKVFIVMKNVKTIDESAIVILLSIMIRFKSQKIRFNGDFPDNINVARSFKESGFFEILNSEQLRDTDRYTVNKRKIYTHAWKNVDAELSQKIMEDISPALHGEKRVYKGLHRTFVELMQNSYNHATPSKEGEKHWWISVNVNSLTKIVSFSFIDYGVGIFESLNTKGSGSKWFNWQDKFKKIFSFETNSDILRLILDGELHKTVTGEYFRGKGLPGIKEAMDRNLINNLHIVTNDVYANVADNVFERLSHNFEGTFVYWEINENTENMPWIQ